MAALLGCVDKEQCSKLIEKAYDIEMKFKGPHIAYFWLQTCHRDCNENIWSTKFLWAPYWPRYYWIELLESEFFFVGDFPVA